MRNFTTRIQNKANALALRARMALSNQRGDFYISDAVKIIIAVVLGPSSGGPDPHFQRHGDSAYHQRDRGPVWLKSPAGIGLWVSTAGPRFFSF